MSSEPAVKIMYSHGADALYLYFVPDPKVAKTREFSDDIVLDFDESNRLVGIEILEFVSSKHDIPGLVQAYKLDPGLPNALEEVRDFISDSSVHRVSKELVLA